MDRDSSPACTRQIPVHDSGRMSSRRLLLLGCLAMGAGCTSLRLPDFAPASPRLRVITYNINWGAADREAVVTYLREADADIVCLQETHPQWEALLKSRLAQVYPHSRFITAGGAGGIAIMAKSPLHDVRVLPAEAGWFPALSARVDTAIGRVHVLNVHLRPPLSERGSATPSALYQSPKIHRAELEAFLDAMDPAAPLLVAGDFNEDEDDGGAGQLVAKGFVDALSSFDRRTRTWEWPVASGITLRRRYDHIMSNAPLRCTGARVDDVTASDHFPVYAVFVAARGA